jgi:dTMP kinase
VTKPSEGMGVFIAFEGVDGAGTTTQAQLLEQWLEGLGRKALLTREPTDGPIGLTIRAILEGRLKDPRFAEERSPTDPAVMALLFAADRIDHMSQEMRPALEAGTDVITDRYLCSSLAYQSVDLPLEWVREINARAMNPDLTIYLRVPLKVAMTRIEKRQGDSRDLYENRKMLEAVTNGYERVFSTSDLPGVVVLDGTETIESLAAKIQDVLRERFSFGD